MTAEAPPSTPPPRPKCPRCGTALPPVNPGTQVLRCAGCGAALQVSVRPVEPPRPPVPEPPPAASPGVARPRRRPMVEVPGPRRAEAEPAPEPAPAPLATITVELSQSDIEAEEPTPTRTPTPATPPPVPATPAPVSAAPAPAPAPLAPAASVDVSWYAEDIERLPEANVDLGQLALESLESLPPLPLRLDVPSSSQAAAAPARPAGVPTSHSSGK